MVYEFEITSEEKADFSRMIKIKEDQTFLELHNAIQSSVGYDDTQMASFYTIDSLGMRSKEVSLFEMSDDDNDIDAFVMDVTMIREVVNEKNKTLVYVFDFFGDRSFTINFIGEEDEEVIKYPVCTLCVGDAPEQLGADQDLFATEEPAAKKPMTADDYLNDPYLMDDEDDGIKFESLDDFQDIL